MIPEKLVLALKGRLDSKDLSGSFGCLYKAYRKAYINVQAFYGLLRRNVIKIPNLAAVFSISGG